MGKKYANVLQSFPRDLQENWIYWLTQVSLEDDPMPKHTRMRQNNDRCLILMLMHLLTTVYTV